MNSLPFVLLAWSVLLGRASDRILARSDDLFYTTRLVLEVLLLIVVVVDVHGCFVVVVIVLS